MWKNTTYSFCTTEFSILNILNIQNVFLSEKKKKDIHTFILKFIPILMVYDFKISLLEIVWHSLLKL